MRYQLTLACAGLLILILPGEALTTADGFEYSVSDGAVTITGYSGSNSAISLPSSIDGLPVTRIGAGAFDSLTSLTQITIPKSVTSIEAGPFAEDTQLVAINVAAGNPVFSSVNGVLFDANQTTLIQYPPGLGSYEYVIPQGVTSIGDYAFSYSNNLGDVTIPDSVTKIGSYAFYFSELERITIPDSVGSIGDYAFNHTYLGFNSYAGIGSVFIPATVTSIGLDAFGENYSLVEINVATGNPAYCSVDGILFDASQTNLIQCPTGHFSYFNGQNYIIPQGVTSIGDYAFDLCTNLTGITIPDGVASIGDGAFYNCYSLVSVTLSKNITSIGSYTFFGCLFNRITIPNGVTTIEAYAFANCEFLSNVAIPNSVISIGAYAFNKCGLYNITVPASVDSIGDSAFSNCPNLNSVSFLGNAPTMGKGVFTDAALNFSIYYLSNSTGFTSPTWTDSSGDTYPASLPHLFFSKVVESTKPFSISLSSYGLSTPYQIQTALPSWITFNSTTGEFDGTAPFAAGRVLGAIDLKANSSGQTVDVSIEIILTNNLNDSGIFHLDVGDVPQSGETDVSNNGMLTVTGWGTGLGNGSGLDGYQYVYLPVTGDFTFITQINSQIGGGESGIVVKDELDVWSSVVAVMLKSGAGTAAEYEIGSNPAYIPVEDTSLAQAPETIGLVRSGNIFTEYELTGNFWKQIGTSRFPMPSTVYVGLAESSDNNSASATATFSNVQVLPYAE